MPGALAGLTLMRDFYQEIIDIIGAGGEDCCVFSAGDPEFEAADHLTFLTKGVGDLDGLTCTYSEDRRDFDKPTIHVRNRTLIPIRWQLNTTDEWATTPDIAAFSRDDTGSNPMSMGGLISISAGSTTRTILSKQGGGGAREWQYIVVGTEKLRLRLDDDSAAVSIFKEVDAVLSLGVPLFVASTYDANASAKAAAADDIAHYVNGLAVASTSTNNASYEGMEALGAAVYLGAQSSGGVSGEFGDWMSTVFFTHRLLSAVEVLNLNDIYVAMQRAQHSPQLAGIF